MRGERRRNERTVCRFGVRCGRRPCGRFRRDFMRGGMPSCPCGPAGTDPAVDVCDGAAVDEMFALWVIRDCLSIWAVRRSDVVQPGNGRVVRAVLPCVLMVVRVWVVLWLGELTDAGEGLVLGCGRLRLARSGERSGACSHPVGRWLGAGWAGWAGVAWSRWGQWIAVVCFGSGCWTVAVVPSWVIEGVRLRGGLGRRLCCLLFELGWCDVGAGHGPWLPGSAESTLCPEYRLWMNEFWGSPGQSVREVMVTVSDWLPWCAAGVVPSAPTPFTCR